MMSTGTEEKCTNAQEKQDHRFHHSPIAKVWLLGCMEYHQDGDALRGPNCLLPSGRKMPDDPKRLKEH
jgi:hypothetical protein